MKDDHVFVDTNIFIYASLEGNHQGGKRDKAIEDMQHNQVIEQSLRIINPFI